ncbi:lysophospholipid acyltransferase family protein [Streptomyces sp. NPDC101249]|uniref:lysophospholipid acyltransferase family protein n=1 Tax=Streptomyces sp. NPDC101249 TaxID=3366140 RepID=UPI00382E486F
MLSALARAVVPVLGRLTVTSGAGGVAPGSIVAANHTALVDPGLVLAALRRAGVEPVVLAAAGLWRVPVLGGCLTREGHVPVRRGSARAAESLGLAARALAAGRVVMLYPEGGLPSRRDAGDRAPEAFRSGLARLALATGAPVVPLGHAGARRIVSGSGIKQLAGVCTAPLRRPALHVHLGEPVTPRGDVAAATAELRAAVHRAWRHAVEQLASDGGRRG